MGIVKAAHRIELMGKVPSGGVGVEVGVQRGIFSEIVVRVNRPRILYLVDLWERLPGDGMPEPWDDDFQIMAMHCTLHRLRTQIASGVVRPLCGFSTDMANMFKDGELDWVYIDANHMYDACMADLRAWSPKVKLGGYVMGHDYERKCEWARKGTIRAVDEFMASKGQPKLGVTTEGYSSFWCCKTWRD